MRMTDYMEAALVEMLRGQGLTLPASWHLGLASVAGDASISELAGTGYARVAVARSLAAWSGTQGAGTTLASSGTSHQTSNNAAVDFGTAGSAWGDAEHIVLFDAATAGNAWAYAPLDSPLTIGDGDPVLFAAGSIRWTLGLTGGMTDYLANKLIDLIWRGQAFAWPATTFMGYAIGAPSNAAAGAEPGVGGYQRVGIASSLAEWAAAVGGETSNVGDIVFPQPTADQGTATHAQQFDAITGGNLLFWRPLASAKTVTAGQAPPRFDAGGYTIAFQ